VGETASKVKTEREAGAEGAVLLGTAMKPLAEADTEVALRPSLW
jgi:hypothetical protein